MMRQFSFILLFFSFLCSWAQERKLFYDHLTETNLCSVPESWFDDENWEQIKAANPNTRFTFLPIVRIEGAFGYDYSPGTFTVAMPDGEVKEGLLAKIKWRGGSTNIDGKHKRNYHIKFLKEDGTKKNRRFFGLRDDNNWLLDAAQVDMSRCRNRVANDLWLDFAAKPYYAELEPNARSGIRGQYVELFLGDEYRGIYCMTENIDRDQMNLKKYEEKADGTPEIHGQLWKCDGMGNSRMVDTVLTVNNDLERWGDYVTKYPDIDDVCPTDYSVIYNAVKLVMLDSDEQTYQDHMFEVFDRPVIRDFHLLTMVLWALDNISGKNTFWACYDKATSPKITMAIWDLDMTVGQNYDPWDFRPERMGPEEAEFDSNCEYYIERPKNTNLHGFNDEIIERYKALRETYFDTDSLINRYAHYIRMFQKSGAADREYQRWNGDSDIGNRNLDFEEELAFIADWFRRHMAHLDNGVIDFDPLAAVPVISATPQPDKAYYSPDGKYVGDNRYALPSGIYLHQGRKILISKK